MTAPESEWIDPLTAQPADFPRYRDRECPHPEDRQQPDGGGTICLDCSAIQVTVRRW